MRYLKAIGAFLLFLVGALGLQALLEFAVVSSGLYHPSNGWTPGDFALSDGLGLIAALIALFGASALERRHPTEYYLPRRRILGDVAEGFAWGAAAPAVAALLVIAAGGATFHGLALHGGPLVRSALAWFGTMLILGAFEEIAFRSYALHVLARRFGFRGAAIVNAVLFGALHYFTKPMETLADAAGVMLITLFVCLTIARTNALWFAIGFHAAFDYLALIVLGSPNTGNQGQPIAGHLLDLRYTGPSWLTGGPCGLEASAPMFLAMTVLFVSYLQRTRRR